MLGFTHALIGAALCKSLGLTNNWIELGLAALLAVLPDIDHPNSLFGTVFRPISIKIFSKMGHRNITHSVFFMTICLTPLLFTSYFLLGFAAIGSHLVADSLTYTGVPLLWPYTLRNFTFLGGPVRTGTIIEAVICLLCMGVILFVQI